MSKFTQEQQTEIVKNARDLTAAIMVEESELARLKKERFKPLPNAPVRKQLEAPKNIEPQFPKAPKSKYTFGEFMSAKVNEIKDLILNKHRKHLIIIAIIFGALIVIGLILKIATKKVDIITPLFMSLPLLIFSLGIPALLAYVAILFVNYRSKLKELNNQLAKSPEYLKAVDEAKKKADEANKQAKEKTRLEQEKLDKEYASKKEEYDKIIIPQYNQELSLWNDIQKKKISIIEEDKEINTATLNELYNTTKIISSTYRDINILSWLYEDMSTSDHDILYATELLDRQRQLLATTEAGEKVRNAVNDMNNSMMEGFSAVYGAIESGNEIQEDMLATLSKTRRDMNIGNVVGTVQRHNTNKTLNKIIK